MNEFCRFEIDEDGEGMRVDKYLSDALSGFSRTTIKDKSEVFVNGQPCKASRRLRFGEVLEVRLPEVVALEVAAEDIPLDIVYEDSDIAIVNKPQGMCVHPAPGNMSKTLVNALLYHIDDLSGINGVIRPGIVHRIDMDTSGLLVIAKNDLAHNALSEQFSVHSITREYLAIAHGVFAKETGTINTLIGRNPRDRKKMAVLDNGGKRAVTHYRVISQSEKYAFVSATLETGRTHQIRVHLSHIGHPIVGDPLYGRGTPLDKRFAGQLLHAARLGFIHPSTHEYVEFYADPPEYFREFML